MPAQSQQQQKLFGLALAVKRGEVPASEVSDEVKAIVDRMSEKDIEDFAGTKHDGLPKKVEAQLREIVREIMRERAMKEAELPKAMIPGNVKANLNMAIDRIKDTNLTYYQKLQVIGKIIDSLGIDKKELVKISNKLKGTLESVNEVASRTAMEIGGLTGMNKDAIQKFVDDNNLDIEKVFQFVKKGKLSDRMEMVSAVAGKPGNPIQKKIIKMFGESVNEAMKPSQVRSVISKVKKDLMKKWQQKGGYENFGDKEGDMLRKKFNFNPYGSSEEREIAQMIQGFENWAMNYDGNMREDLNEGPSTEEKRIAMLAVRKQAKYRNVSLEQAIQDQINALEDLQRDIKKGKIK